jgi:hypothetical protein
MTLEMRTECERCHAPVHNESIAFICVYECTFCSPCTENMENICPNCGGELVRRPRKRIHHHTQP